jgi:hypothetical protein
MRSTSHPFSGRTKVSANRYPLVTHWIVERLEFRSAARFDRETLTIVASSCASSAPNSATVEIFQTEGSSRPFSGALAAAISSASPDGLDLAIGADKFDDFLRCAGLGANGRISAVELPESARREHTHEQKA